jgi:hypothetical protein
LEGLEAGASFVDGVARIEVVAEDSSGLPRNFLDISATVIRPDLETVESQLLQVGAGEYAVDLAANQPGAYLVRLHVEDDGEVLGQQTLGLVVPYSPEYLAGGTDRALLGRLADITGGGELPDPPAAFARDLTFASQVQEIWAILLLITVLLFPLDIAVSRVMLGSQALRKVTGWVQARMPARPALGGDRERVLGHLFSARQRVRQQQARPSQPTAAPTPTRSSPSSGERQPSSTAAPGEPSPGEDTGEDALARLHAAKRRASRRRT